MHPVSSFPENSVKATIQAEDAGINLAALDTLRNRIQEEVDAGRMPAAQMALAVDQELAVFESFGSASNQTEFNIFSCTKALIAGVVWQLIAEGRFDVDTRAIELIPAFGTRGKTPDWMAQVTLGQLLTHTSGFPTAPLGPPTWDTRAGRQESFSRWHASFEPGTHFEYHPTAAHWVVAEMIEVVEDSDYREVVRRRIIEPLGLTSISLGNPPDEQGEVAELQTFGELPSSAELEAVFGTSDFDIGEVTPAILLGFNHASIRAAGIPAGGGIATAAALAMYYQALLHNPGQLWDPEVLAEGTAKIMCTLPSPDTGVASNRSLGLIIAGDDGLSIMRGMGANVSAKAFGHNGAGGQIAWADPATGLSFALTTSGVDMNFIREAGRTASLSSKAAVCVTPKS
ncbi:penicillin-binding protein, beta-lactamase class C [Actinobacteria bacterium IMCC26207]|nr:penicillin-binding protein, beta-lactamase class C [Actinobacteria bacterium IMCC26207]